MSIVGTIRNGSKCREFTIRRSEAARCCVYAFKLVLDYITCIFSPVGSALVALPCVVVLLFDLKL